MYCTYCAIVYFPCLWTLTFMGWDALAKQVTLSIMFLSPLSFGAYITRKKLLPMEESLEGIYA